MPSFSHKDEDFSKGHFLSEDTHVADYAWNDWTVYPKYHCAEYEGRSVLFVDTEDPSGTWFTDRRRYKPLSRQYAALFLEFARWPEERGMDMKNLGAPKNVIAAHAWAELYGLLGLGAGPTFEVWSDANEVMQHHLGIRRVFRPRKRNEAMGGIDESVEAFALEAWVANTALRLYEAASAPEGPDVELLEMYMPERRAFDLPSIKDLHGKDPKRAQDWALRVVSDIVEERMGGHVWPVAVRDGLGIGYSRGWAFDSLLGAMWLQMSWLLMHNARRCEYCGKLLDIDLPHTKRPTASGENKGSRKRRSDTRFCNNGGKCRSNWNYRYGTGRSSRAAKQRKRRGEADAN